MSNCIRTSWPVTLFKTLPRLGPTFFRYYEKLHRRLTPRHRAKTFFGCKIDCNAQDLIQNRIIHFGSWEPDICRVFLELIGPGDFVLDVGSNIGFYTLLSSKLVTDSGRVVSIEASPSIYRLLERQIKLNKCKNVRTMNLAASSKDEIVNIYAGPYSNIGMTTTLASKGHTLEDKVQGLSLPQILGTEELKKFSFIKIDIEGAEPPVLTAILDNLDLYADKLSILVEASAQHAPQEWGKLFNRFVASGFSAYAISNEYSLDWYYNWSPTPPRLLTTMPKVQTDILFLRNTTSL